MLSEFDGYGRSKLPFESFFFVYILQNFGVRELKMDV